MTHTPQPKALELADQLAVRKVSNWVHGTGDTPRRNGFCADQLCAEAAAELRRQHAEIADLREQLERKSDAIQRLWAERDSLRAEVERLRADAERLDFITEHRVLVSPEFEGCWDATRYDDEPEPVASFSGATPRAAIDAAREAKG